LVNINQPRQQTRLLKLLMKYKMAKQHHLSNRTTNGEVVTIEKTAASLVGGPD